MEDKTIKYITIQHKPFEGDFVAKFSQQKELEKYLTDTEKEDIEVYEVKPIKWKVIVDNTPTEKGEK